MPPIAKVRTATNALADVDLNAARIILIRALANALTHNEIAALKLELDPHRGPQAPRHALDEHFHIEAGGDLHDRAEDQVRNAGGNIHDLRAVLEEAINTIDEGAWEGDPTDAEIEAVCNAAGLNEPAEDDEPPRSSQRFLPD